MPSAQQQSRGPLRPHKLRQRSRPDDEEDDGGNNISINDYLRSQHGQVPNLRCLTGPAVEDPAAPLLVQQAPAGINAAHAQADNNATARAWCQPRAGVPNLVAWLACLAAFVVLPTVLLGVLAPTVPHPSDAAGSAPVTETGVAFSAISVTTAAGNHTESTLQQIVAVSETAEVVLLVLPMVLALAVAVGCICYCAEALLVAVPVVITCLVLLPVWLFVPLDAGGHVGLLAAITLPTIIGLLVLGASGAHLRALDSHEWAPIVCIALGPMDTSTVN